MKNVPFYFHIDRNDVDFNDPKQALMYSEYKNWMGYAIGIGDYRFTGFDKNTRGEAFASSTKPIRNKKVSLEFWEKYIKGLQYNVVSSRKDSWGDFYSDHGIFEGITTVPATRNKIVLAPSRLKEITKELKRIGQDPKQWKGAYPLLKNACVESEGMFGLMSEDRVAIDNRYTPKSIVMLLIKKDPSGIIKCPLSGSYVRRSSIDDENIVMALNIDGVEIEFPHYYHSPIRSNRHNKFFVSTNAARANGFVKCEGTNDWVLDGEEIEIPNAGYHNLERKMMFKVNPDFTVGFEIEKEDKKARNEVGYEKLFDNTSWCKERDGSLDQETGYELVSPVYNLFSKDMDNDIKNSKELTQLIDAKYSNRCGGHINIGSKVYSPMQLLWGLKGFLPLLYAIWSVRVDNSYSRAMSIGDYGGSKNAIKVKRNVIEIRIATAVKSVKNMLWRRDLVRIMMRNINKSEAEVLRMMLNPRSALHKHLRKVYNASRFMDKCNQFVKFSDAYNNIKLEEVNWDAIDAAKAESSPSIEED